MTTFNSTKWMKKYKTALIEAKSEKSEHLKDLLHTVKVDDKKPEKVDIKKGAENDLAIEKDKDGNDVMASGLKEASIDRKGVMIKGFVPGDMWRNDFDYIGMLKYGSQATADLGLETLQELFESFQDVNYHREGADLGNAIDWMEDVKPNRGKAGVEEKVSDFMERFRKKCTETLKVMGIKWTN